MRQEPHAIVLVMWRLYSGSHLSNTKVALSACRPSNDATHSFVACFIAG